MKRYLYGASVQGIQSFIFETNKLKEIVGASELVEQICTTEFTNFCSEFNHQIIDDNVIMRAAGNIKYEVDEQMAKNIVLNFPKHISNFAPGITISQAVVELTENIKNDIDNLEERLKIQRNKAQMPIDIGFMGVERDRRTSKPAFNFDEKDKKEIDRGTTFKQEVKSKRLMANFLGKKEKDVKNANIPFDIEKITDSNENSWLAIVHADGNGLGNIIQNLAKNITLNNDDAKKAFKIFSEKLEEATNESAQAAFHKVVSTDWQSKIENSKDDTYPIRPVILGGDDLTIIIRADLAFDFTTKFLQEFEIKTKEKFTALNQFGINDKFLTACAGIAYIKDNYPFHYGYDLAESLVKEAKSFSKRVKEESKLEIQPSSLSFYKVQASFIEDLKDMKKRTHYAELSDIHFDFGPYLLHERNGKPNLGELNTFLKSLEKYKTDKTKGVSKLRQWISELYKDNSKADFLRNRIISVNSKFSDELKLKDPITERENKDEKDINQKFTIYKDLIDLHTFKTLYDGN